MVKRIQKCNNRIQTELEFSAHLLAETAAFFMWEQSVHSKFKKYDEFSVASATQRWFIWSFGLLIRLQKPAWKKIWSNGKTNTYKIWLMKMHFGFEKQEKRRETTCTYRWASKVAVNWYKWLVVCIRRAETNSKNWIGNAFWMWLRYRTICHEYPLFLLLRSCKNIPHMYNNANNIKFTAW